MKTKIFGLIFTFITLGLFFTMCQKASQPLDESTPELRKAPADWSYLSYPLPLPTNTAGDLLTVPLYAGKTTLVGNVTVDQVNGNLLIRYNVLDDCVTLLSTHLSVTATLDDVPQASGNPIPGNFNYFKNNWPGHFDGNDWVFDPIPIPSGLATSGPNMNKVFIAAHAVVTGPCVGNCMADVTALNTSIAAIPCTTTATLAAGSDRDYFEIEIAGDGDLNGNHEGWCFDATRGFPQGLPYTTPVKIISTLDPNFATLLTGYMDNPGNVGALNWLLNMDFVGKTCTCPVGGVYTRYDVQSAIWSLLRNLDNVTHPEYFNNANIDRVNCLVNEAKTHLSFVPGCDQVVGIVLMPVDASCAFLGEQPALISIPMPCKCGEETAWAIGKNFLGNNWAMYFNYIVTP